MKLAKLAAVVAIATLTLAAAPPTRRGLPPPAPKTHSWLQTVAVTPGGGHIVGNPQAAVKLVEFASYTCPHCANFERQGADALLVGYVDPGKVSFEVRHFVRDPVDMTVALLTNCGDPKRFFGNHTVFLRRQDRWIATMEKAGPGMRQRWSSGEFATRMRAIASDLGFYPMMAARGYDRPTIDRCLADQGKAQKLAEMTQAAIDSGVGGTPSFTIDGTLSDIHDWRSLETALRDKLRGS